MPWSIRPCNYAHVAGSNGGGAAQVLEGIIVQLPNGVVAGRRGGGACSRA